MSRQSIGMGHLWAIGYADMERAAQVKEEIIRLGWVAPCHFILSAVAVVVRHPDGSFTLDREPFPAFVNILGCTAVGFIAGLVLAAPLTGAAVGAFLGGLGTAQVATAVGIDDEFVREVEGTMKPRDLGAVCAGPRGRYGRDSPQDSRARWDGAEDERRCGAGEADPGGP